MWVGSEKKKECLNFTKDPHHTLEINDLKCTEVVFSLNFQINRVVFYGGVF